MLEKLSPSVILTFNENQINEVRKTFNYDDLRKLEQDLDNFDDWIQKQNHFVVKHFDRNYLERFLIANKGSVEIAKKRFDKLCTFRTLMPDFLRNINVNDEFSRLIKWNHSCILPQPTKDNYRVLATMVHDPEATEYIDFIEYYRFMLSIMEYVLNHDYNAGYEVIFDTSMFTLGVVSKLNPIGMKKATTIFLEAISLRIKRIHIVSGSKLFDLVLSIIKQSLSEKLVRRIIIHDKPVTVSEYICKDILPIEYGGFEKSMKELCESNFNEMRTQDHTDRLKFIDGAITDESKRLTQVFNEEYLGTPGSFKTLCVD